MSNSTITEKVELLGKGLYDKIPDVLTLHAIPTISELDWVGSEDFESVMLDKILPDAVEEDVDFKELLEIDFQWICRCLRLLNYGPYYTTNAIFCTHCGSTSYGEYRVNLNTIECKPLPEGFVNEIKIDKSEFMDFKGDIILKLPTVREISNAYKDKAFQKADGRVNRELARICYMIKSIKGKTTLTPVEIKLMIQEEMSPADYIILKEIQAQLTDYGLRAGGTAQCPKCHQEGAFLALTDDRFFRPTVGDLREWQLSRGERAD